MIRQYQEAAWIRSEKPKVTVLMPVYNGEKYLEEAVNSILNQTFIDFELLIVDDGSTDGSAAIIQAYDDPRIRPVRNEKNLNLAATLNRGIAMARGEYIARMDCDDLSLPERLSRQVSFLDENPSCGLCATNAVAVNTAGENLFNLFPEETAVPLEWTLIWENPIAHPTVMLRKNVLLDFALKYNEIPSEDYDLWCRLVLRAKISRLPEVLLHYRYHPDSSFNIEKKRHLLQAVASSRDLAYALTRREVPAFHGALTVFPKAMGEPSKVYDSGAVEEWLELLLAKSRETFAWDGLSYRYAKEDCRRLLARIAAG